MEILCCTSNEYAPHAGVMLASLFENNKELNFNVYIFTTGFNDENIENMKLLSLKYNQEITIKCFSVDDIGFVPPGNWGIYPYLKLYAAEILTDVDRILYIDTDMIILSSIAKIKDIDLSNYYMAMAVDCQDGQEHKQRLGIPNNNFFGNSGLILFNLRKCREDNLWTKSVEFINKNAELIKFADQDVINKICTGYIYKLGIEWNMMAFYYLNKPLILPELLSLLEEKKNEAIIIHYTCIKPWYKDCDFPLKYQYKRYLAKTMWSHKNNYSPQFKITDYIIKNIRYFFQRIGIKNYDYLYKS